MRVFLTADVHGGFLRFFDFHYSRETSREDIMIILGDAGINYYLSDRDQSRKKLLDKLPLTLLCIHGNHEERPELIDTYVEKEWQGGKVYVEEKLDSVNWEVDYVFSHTAPLKYEPIEVFLPGIDQSRVDKSTEIWLDKIEEKLKYKKWYCGHYHTKKRLENIEFMYENYIEFPEEELK